VGCKGKINFESLGGNRVKIWESGVRIKIIAKKSAPGSQSGTLHEKTDIKKLFTLFCYYTLYLILLRT